MGDKTEEKKLICIGCPMGCPITVVMCGKEVVSITGNTCSHGAKYAAKEVTAPTRVLTTTVRVAGQKTRMLSVKTRTDIPKEKIYPVLFALKNLVYLSIIIHQINPERIPLHCEVFLYLVILTLLLIFTGLG